MALPVFRSLTLATLLTFLVTSCGIVNKTPTSVTPETLSAIDFEGVAQAGRVMFGIVHVYGLVLGKRGPLLAETVTDAEGKYRFRMRRYYGPIEIVVTGGPGTTYLDEASGQTINMRAGDSLTTVVPTGAIPGIYPVTPITHIAAEVAKTEIEENGDEDPQAISRSVARAKEKVASMFNTTPDVLDAIPSDPGSKVDADSREGKAAQKLAGLSQFIKNAGKQSEPFEALKSLVEDGKDGEMDGKAFGEAVSDAAKLMTKDFSSSLKKADTDFLKSDTAVARNFEDFKKKLEEEEAAEEDSSSDKPTDVVVITEVGQGENESVRDTTPPVLLSITFPSTPVAGSTGIVEVKMNDDLSGFGYFEGRLVPDFENGGNAVINFSGYSDSYYYYWGSGESEDTSHAGETSLTAQLHVGKYFPPGPYRLESFSASDRAGNSIYLYANPGDTNYPGTERPIVKVDVENPGPFDITAPTLDSISFPVPPVAGTGGKVTVVLNEDVSGVASFYGQLVPDFDEGGHAAINFCGGFEGWCDGYSMSGNWNGNWAAATDMGNNTFSVEFPVNEFFPPGIYRLGHFSVTDHAGYATTYSAGRGETTYHGTNKPVDTVVVVNHGKPDITGPTLVDLTSETLVAGSVGRVKVKVTDNVSGVVSFSGRLVPNLENGGTASISFSGNIESQSTQRLEDDTYSVEVQVGEFFPPGEYRLESFEAYDKAGYQTSYRAVNGEAFYEYTEQPVLKVMVQNPNTPDVTGPTLVSLDFPNPLEAGTKGSVTVEITDNVSGVAAFYGRLVPESGDYGSSIEFYGSIDPDHYYYWGGMENTTAVGENTFSVQFDVNASVPSGTYRLESFEAYDKAGNHSNYWAGSGSETYSNSSVPIAKVEVIGQEEVEVSGEAILNP